MKNKKKLHVILWSIAIAVAITVLLGWNLVASLGTLRNLRTEKERAMRQLEDVYTENQELRDQLNETKTDDYVIRMASKLLGWVFPAEFKIIEENGA